MKYYVIYERLSIDAINNQIRWGKFYAIVENKEVAEHFCKYRPELFYTESDTEN